MAGASALKELLISAHGDAERVDHLVPQALRTLQNVLVHAKEILYAILKNAKWKFFLLHIPDSRYHKIALL